MATVGNVDMSGWRRQSSAPFLDGNNPNQVRSGTRQNLIFEDLFDDGVDLVEPHYRIAGNAPTINHAEQRMEMWLDRDNVGGLSPNPFRTSVLVNGLDTNYFGNGMDAIIGDTYWYACSVFLQSDHVIETSSREIIVQWHGTPDSGLGEISRNPPISLRTESDRYVLRIVGDSNALTVGTNYTRSSGAIDLSAVLPTVGKWTSWVFKVKWGYDNTGSIDLYQDGISVYSEVNAANCFNDVRGPYFYPGLYKWEWKVGEPETDTRTRLYYFDNIRIGNENATLSDVWEDHS